MFNRIHQAERTVTGMIGLVWWRLNLPSYYF